MCTFSDWKIVLMDDDEALHLALKRAKNRYASRKQLQDYTAFLEKEKAQIAQELIKTYSFQKNLIESSMDGILGCDESEHQPCNNALMQTLQCINAVIQAII